MFARCLAAAAAALLSATPCLAQTFADAPVSCGSMTHYKTCTAAFDGRTLRVTHTPPEGKPSLAVYRHCVATPSLIHCPEGRWETEGASGPLGARSLGLRDSRPFKD